MEKILFVLKDTIGYGDITIPGASVLVFKATEYGAALPAPTSELIEAFANRVQPLGFNYELIEIDNNADVKTPVKNKRKVKK